jgi:hypothetical protein
MYDTLYVDYIDYQCHQHATINVVNLQKYI